MQVGQKILVRERMFDAAELEVIGLTEKAVKVRNTYCGRECYFPKVWLRAYKPNDPSYEGEYVIPVRYQFSKIQEQVLNIAE